MLMQWIQGDGLAYSSRGVEGRMILRGGRSMEEEVEVAC